MKLHAGDGQCLVLDAHDLAVVIVCEGVRPEIRGQGLRGHRERVVPARHQGGRQAGEEPRPVVHDGRGLAVHQTTRSRDTPAKSGRERLMTQADAQDRQPAHPRAQQGHGDAGRLGSARSGGDDDVRRRQLGDLGQVDRVISADDD